MKILLDTCVLAELRHPDGNSSVKTALAQLPDECLFLSALTMGEIAKGVSLLSPGRKQQALSAWLNGLEAQYAERIVPIELETARLWGDLTARAQRSGILIPAVDGLICATALQHGMRIMTRNARHFEASGAMVIDPWQTA